MSIGPDGTVRSRERIEHFGAALANDPSLVSEGEPVPATVIDEVKQLESTNKKENPTHGKLVISEEIAKGHVTWESLKLYISGLGGDYPLTFFSIWISALVLTNCVETFQIWFLGYWGSKYETHAPSEVNAFL